VTIPNSEVTKIRKRYRVEAAIGDCSDEEKYRKRQTLSVPLLNELKGRQEYYRSSANVECAAGEKFKNHIYLP